MKETTFDTVKLIHGDCMEYLRSLPDNAFDLAVVDPPYGDGGSELKGAICGRYGGKFEKFMGSTPPPKTKRGTDSKAAEENGITIHRITSPTERHRTLPRRNIGRAVQTMRSRGS